MEQEHYSITNLRRFAYDILYILGENEELRDYKERNDDYKTKYAELLDSSISHSQAMIGNVLKAQIEKCERTSEGK